MNKLKTFFDIKFFKFILVGLLNTAVGEGVILLLLHLAGWKHFSWGAGMAAFVGTGMNKGGNSKRVDELTTPLLDALDIAGYNYASGRYPLEAKAHPDRVIFGSETFPQDSHIQ